MTVERLPLGEFSSSRINKLHSSTGGFKQQERNILLPSITNMINTYKPASDKPLIKSTLPLQLPTPRQSQHAKTVESEPLTRADSSDNSADTTQFFITPERSQTRQFDTTISHKLKVRLQLAYYKYKTNQTHLKFNQLKLGKNSVHVSKKTKRKLVVSQGKYNLKRTPVKRGNTQSTNNNANSSQYGTPLSVKAAKSLLQLCGGANWHLINAQVHRLLFNSFDQDSATSLETLVWYLDAHLYITLVFSVSGYNQRLVVL